MTFAQLLSDVAYAQAAGGKAQPSLPEILLMPAVLLVIMYVMVIRPQQKKAKDQSKLIQMLKVGDEVETSGGIIGRVKAIAENFVTIDAGQNTTFKIKKNHITGPSQPAPAKAEAK